MEGAAGSESGRFAWTCFRTPALEEARQPRACPNAIPASIGGLHVKRTIEAALGALALAMPAGAGPLTNMPFQTPEQWQVSWDRLNLWATQHDAQWTRTAKGCAMSWRQKPGVRAVLLSNREGHFRTYCFVISTPTIDCYEESGGKEVWANLQYSAQQAAPAPATPPFQHVPPLVDWTTGSAWVPIFTTSSNAVQLSVKFGSYTSARMTLDTGCSSMSVTRSMAGHLLRAGDATAAEPVDVVLADGKSHPEDQIVIARVDLGGGHVAYNVKSTVTEDGGMSLLGMAALNQMGKFTIDTAAGQLVFG
jgi:hypothetical protein